MASPLAITLPTILLSMVVGTLPAAREQDGPGAFLTERARQAPPVPLEIPRPAGNPRLSGALQIALPEALERLRELPCQQVFEDFVLPGGGTPGDELRREGVSPAEFLLGLEFRDGSHGDSCLSSSVALTTQVGARVVSVCPEAFVGLARSHAGRAAALLIHEELHALGLREDPPDPSAPPSEAITRQVLRRCGG